MEAGIRGAIRIIHLDGQPLTMWSGPHGERRAKEYAGEVVAVPHTALYLTLTSVRLEVLVKAAGLAGAWDYAVPQEWFDEYLRKWGKRPIGVWWYPRKDDAVDGAYWLMGRFVGVEELVERIGRRIAAGEADVHGL